MRTDERGCRDPFGSWSFRLINLEALLLHLPECGQQLLLRLGDRQHLPRGFLVNWCPAEHRPGAVRSFAPSGRRKLLCDPEPGDQQEATEGGPGSINSSCMRLADCSQPGCLGRLHVGRFEGWRRLYSGVEV